jgi:hypothetical protein
MMKLLRQRTAYSIAGTTQSIKREEGTVWKGLFRDRRIFGVILLRSDPQPLLFLSKWNWEKTEPSPTVLGVSYPLGKTGTRIAVLWSINIELEREIFVLQLRSLRI